MGARAHGAQHACPARELAGLSLRRGVAQCAHHQQGGDRWRVLDPVGHTFCLVTG